MLLLVNWLYSKMGEGKFGSEIFLGQKYLGLKFFWVKMNLGRNFFWVGEKVTDGLWFLRKIRLTQLELSWVWQITTRLVRSACHDTARNIGDP